MKVTKKMIDDMFKIISASLDIVATIPPNTTTLTKKQVVVDVLAKTFDSLKSDLEQYFIDSSDSSVDSSTDFIPQMTEEMAVNRIKNAMAEADTKTPASTFEKIWSVAGPILDLVEDTAKSNLPKGSTALNVMITVLDTISAFGDELNLDLPKMKTS